MYMYVNHFVLHTIALMLLGFVFVLFLDGGGSPLGGLERSECYERFRNGYGWGIVSMKGGEPCLSRDDRSSKHYSGLKVTLSRCHITGYSLACQTLDIMSLSCDWVPFRCAVVVLRTRRDELQERGQPGDSCTCLQRKRPIVKIIFGETKALV